MKVYVIQSGCRFRGSEIVGIYTYKPNAIAQGELILKDKILAIVKAGRDHLGWNKWKEVAPEANVIKAWQSQVEEIIIYEYDTR